MRPSPNISFSNHPKLNSINETLTGLATTALAESRTSACGRLKKNTLWHKDDDDRVVQSDFSRRCLLQNCIKSHFVLSCT